MQALGRDCYREWDELLVNNPSGIRYYTIRLYAITLGVMKRNEEVTRGEVIDADAFLDARTRLLRLKESERNEMRQVYDTFLWWYDSGFDVAVLDPNRMLELMKAVVNTTYMFSDKEMINLIFTGMPIGRGLGAGHLFDISLRKACAEARIAYNTLKAI